MRKLILISAFVLASVSVQAVEARELILAASDAPVAAAPVAAAATPAAATPTPVAATATTAAPAATADSRARRRLRGSRPPVPEEAPGPSRDRRAEGAPDRRQVWNLLVMRKFVIVAVMFWLAFAYQNNHRDFGAVKIEAVR